MKVYIHSLFAIYTVVVAEDAFQESELCNKQLERLNIGLKTEPTDFNQISLLVPQSYVIDSQREW